MHILSQQLCALPAMDLLKRGRAIMKVALILFSYSFLSLTDKYLLMLSNLIYFLLCTSDK